MKDLEPTKIDQLIAVAQTVATGPRQQEMAARLGSHLCLDGSAALRPFPRFAEKLRPVLEAQDCTLATVSYDYGYYRSTVVFAWISDPLAVAVQAVLSPDRKPRSKAVRRELEAFLGFLAQLRRGLTVSQYDALDPAAVAAFMHEHLGSARDSGSLQGALEMVAAAARGLEAEAEMTPREKLAAELAEAQARRAETRKKAAAKAAETRRLKSSSEGLLLWHLREAQVHSDRAKVEHSPIRREREYTQKGQHLEAACQIAAKVPGLLWGWDRDNGEVSCVCGGEAQDCWGCDGSGLRYSGEECRRCNGTGDFVCWTCNGRGLFKPRVAEVVYFDLSGGQVSFHSTKRYAGPTYSGDWDQVRDASRDRIQASISKFVEGMDFMTAAPHSRFLRGLRGKVLVAYRANPSATRREVCAMISLAPHRVNEISRAITQLAHYGYLQRKFTPGGWSVVVSDHPGSVNR